MPQNSAEAPRWLRLQFRSSTTARTYDSASPEEKRKIQALLSLWLRELAVGEYLLLPQVLDHVGNRAQARGLTQEMLNSLLKGAQLRYGVPHPMEHR